MSFQYQPSPVSRGVSPDFLNFLLKTGTLLPPKRSEPVPTRWQLREAAGIPHLHLQEKARRKAQLDRIAGKRKAAREINRWETHFARVSPSAIRRKLRESPHVYL
jgi:hypothetical protein